VRIPLITSTEGWHTRDLQRAAKASGVEIEIVSFRKLRANLSGSSSTLAGGEIPLHEFEIILVRNVPAGSLEQVVYRMDALLQLEMSGCRLINRPRAIECCVDKYLAATRMKMTGIPVPRTIVCEYAEDAMQAFEELGGDVVVKPLFGSLGKGMIRVSDPDLAYRAFLSIERLNSVLYLQEFIEHPGWDIRAFVVNDKVIAAMRRFSGDDWRANVALGAPAELYEPSDEERRLAVQAAESVGAEVCGVDLLSGPNGKKYVIEANSVPGWRKLTEVTGVDVAAAVLAYAITLRASI
jgi:ribosomal protein S6--L-glutamate ligase